MHAVIGAPLEVLAGGVDLGEVDDDLRRRRVQCVDAGGDRHAGGVLSDVLGIDGADQLELGVGGHRAGHRLSHAAARTEDRDPRRHFTDLANIHQSLA